MPKQESRGPIQNIEQKATPTQPMNHHDFLAFQPAHHTFCFGNRFRILQRHSPKIHAHYHGFNGISVLPRPIIDKDPNLRRSNNVDKNSQWAPRAVFTPVNKAGTGVIEYYSRGSLEDLGLILIDRGQNRVYLESLEVCLWLVGGCGCAALVITTFTSPRHHTLVHLSGPHRPPFCLENAALARNSASTRWLRS